MSHQKYVTGNAIIIIMSLKNQAITCQEICLSDRSNRSTQEVLQGDPPRAARPSPFVC